MHKNEVIFCILCAALVTLLFLCVTERNEICELKEQMEQVEEEQNRFTALSREISNSSFVFSKTKEELARHNQDVRKILSSISKKSYLKNVKLKIKQKSTKFLMESYLEMQFSATNEQDIYRFIQNLQDELNIVFDSIKIAKKNRKDFITQIKSRYFEFKSFDESINVEPQKRKNICVKRFELFPKDEESKRHVLCGIISKTKAYIDDEWKQIADTIDDCSIKDIFENEIIIEKDGKNERIKLGDSW